MPLLNSILFYLIEECDAAHDFISHLLAMIHFQCLRHSKQPLLYLLQIVVGRLFSYKSHFLTPNMHGTMVWASYSISFCSAPPGLILRSYSGYGIMRLGSKEECVMNTGGGCDDTRGPRFLWIEAAPTLISICCRLPPRRKRFRWHWIRDMIYHSPSLAHERHDI